MDEKIGKEIKREIIRERIFTGKLYMIEIGEWHSIDLEIGYGINSLFHYIKRNFIVCKNPPFSLSKIGAVMLFG